MYKRGNIELLVFVFVGIVALGGLYLAWNPYGQAVRLPDVQSADAYDACMADCAIQDVPDLCSPKCIGLIKPSSSTYTDTPTGRFSFEVAERRQNSITGNFAAPKVKEYGGAIRGVASEGTRAFPAGRAYELPDQACYTCSCLTGGITASERNSAERVCSENCGGVITDVTIGVC